MHKDVEQVVGSRLTAIADMVPQTNVFADIGCDHGKLCSFLLQNKKINKAIACDVSVPSLDKAKTLAQQCCYGDKMICRAGDGLTPLFENEVDVFVIAGMGGRLMIHILQESESIARRASSFVLQPMQQVDDLRYFLRHNHYQIIDERLVEEDGRIYSILHVCDGETHYPERYASIIYDEIGPCIVSHRENFALLKKQNQKEINLRKKELVKIAEGSLEKESDKQTRVSERRQTLECEINWREQLEKDLEKE